MVGDDLTILVAEDNADCRELYSLWFGEEYTVEMATDGDEALAAVDERVDLLFLDRDIPGPSGTEVASEIAAMAADPYVVMVRSMDPDFDIADVPIDGYVQKPVDRSDLLRVVDQCRRQEAYRAALDEFFSLTAKLAAIEAEKDADELADSPEHERLQERVAEKRAEVDRVLSTDEGTDWSLAFKTCPSPTSANAGNPDA